VTCPNGAEVAGIRRAVTEVGEIRVFGVFDYCVVVAANHKSTAPYRTRSFLVGAYNSAIEKDSVAVRPACGGGRPAASEPGVGGRRARDRVHCICLAIVMVGMSLACSPVSGRYGLAASLLQ
jgi:hypothetical protein